MIETQSGAYGDVKLDSNNCGFVIKTQPYIRDCDRFCDQAIRELYFLSSYQHPNLPEVEKITLNVNKKEMSIKMENAGVCLEDFVTQYFPLPMPIFMEIFHQLVTTLIAIHEAGFIYGDLTSRNILIKYGAASLQVKIIDWGSVFFDTTTFESKSLKKLPITFDRCPISFNSPEMATISLMNATTVTRCVTDYKLSAAHDMYSLGMVLFYMLSLKYIDDEDIYPIIEKLNGHENEHQSFFDQLLHRNANGWYGNLLKYPGLSSILKQLLCYNPSCRPTAKQVLEENILFKSFPRCIVPLKTNNNNVTYDSVVPRKIRSTIVSKMAQVCSQSLMGQHCLVPAVHFFDHYYLSYAKEKKYDLVAVASLLLCHLIYGIELFPISDFHDLLPLKKYELTELVNLVTDMIALLPKFTHRIYFDQMIRQAVAIPNYELIRYITTSKQCLSTSEKDKFKLYMNLLHNPSQIPTTLCIDAKHQDCLYVSIASLIACFSPWNNIVNLCMDYL